MSTRVTIDGATAEFPEVIRGFNDNQNKVLKALLETVEELAGGQEGGTFIDATDFDAGTGGDDTARIQAAIDAAVEAGIGRVHLPEGQYTIDCQQIADSLSTQKLITVPSNFAITGDGFGRTVINVTNTTEDVGGWGVNVFGFASNAEHVTFEGLHFKGENDFTYVLNNQNSCIRSLVVSDIIIRNCKFENLWGFSVHDDGSERVHVLNCTFVQCANGVNVNADWSLQVGNVFNNAEGFESSGQYLVVANNTFADALGVAISAGGNISGDEFPGGMICGNTIQGSTSIGIAVADGFCSGVVSNNVVMKCEQGGIIFANSLGPQHSIVIANNVVMNNCSDDGLVSVVGLDVRSVEGKHLIFGNILSDTNLTGYDQRYALSCSSPDCVIFGNYLNGSTKDASFAGARTYTRDNFFVNQTQEWSGSGSFVEDRVRVVDSTDLLETVYKWNHSTSAGRGYFARYASGKMEWGNGLDPRDLTVERSAAGILKVTGKMVATAGLGVGNSASATVLGSVVKKVQIFDASGNSLGYVAVYDAIT